MISMALVEQTKKGGRYTKKEQEERRLQVYHLHFEENKPATEIAELLHVHRNTINDDIKFWYQRISDKTGLDFDSEIKKLIQKKEIQRDRSLEQLEEAETFSERIKIENLISNLDNNHYQFLLKLKSSESENSKIGRELIEESEIKDFVKYLMMVDYKSYKRYTIKELEFRYIKKTKSNRIDSKKAIQTMLFYGLQLCEEFNFSDNNSGEDRFVYDIEKFCSLREYLTEKEWERYEKIQEQSTI